MSFRLKSFILLLVLITTNAFALDFRYKVTNFPTEFDLISLKGHRNHIILDVDLYYPTPSDIAVLKQLNLKKLIVHAGHFPTKDQIGQLDALNTKYDIVISEVFPSIKEVTNINNSNINRLIIKSFDFPTLGEVQIFNKVKIPLTFEILRNDIPLPEHIVIIKKFKKEITIAFNHKMVPGPGYANFYNALKSYKHFKVNEMPYGEDFIGANSLKRTTFEVSAPKRPLKYESIVINKFNIAPTINFENAYPYNKEVFEIIGIFKTNETIIKDNGSGILLNSIFESMLVNKANVIFSFSQFY